MHATRLGQLLRGLLCHVNVIPVNETAEGAYKRPSDYLTRAFQDVLRNEGVPSTVRMEKGIDINAGCGQLRARVLGDRWGAS
jgi:23S rRNA (adenine2503-C2)-methyltransferase